MKERLKNVPYMFIMGVLIIAKRRVNTVKFY